MGLPFCKLPNKFCPICDEEFEPTSASQIYCHDCRKNRNADIQAYIREQKKKGKPTRVRPKSIKRILRDLEQYNKQHGTLLSYGQYVALLDQGMIEDK